MTEEMKHIISSKSGTTALGLATSAMIDGNLIMGKSALL
jgi:hypothetical protein